MFLIPVRKVGFPSLSIAFPPPCFRVLYYIITIIKYKVLCVKINIDEWTIYDDEIEQKSA